MGKLSDVCKSEGIHLKFVDGEKWCDGERTLSELGGAIALRFGKEKYILVDRNAGLIEKQLSAAHELAHHIFGHIGKPETTNAMEEEARLFSVVYAALSIFCQDFLEKEHEN